MISIKRQNKKKLFWLQIVLIIVIGIAASVLVLILSEVYKDKLEEKNAATYTVTFAYQDGTVIEKKSVKEGKGVIPPQFETEEVFRGWSSKINNVRSDLEAHPLIYDINDENLFYFDSVYVKEGEEFTIDLKLAGEVNISSADLSLEYDPKVMTFKKSVDSDVCSVAKEKRGMLFVKLNSDQPLTEKTDLASIAFKAKKKDVNTSRIDLIGKSGTLVENGKEVSATISTINNEIYYLQEVS